VSLEHVLADHTNGKRHQALLTARERFETSQNSSIYVTRIKPEHDETILKNYFSRFGQIKNCFIDKEKVCIYSPFFNCSKSRFFSFSAYLCHYRI
jgi:RNA recognition motif-containing protein